MTRTIPAILTLILLTLLSNTALGFAAVCEEVAADEDRNARSERFVWSYYDYWYAGLYVVSDSSIEDSLPDDASYADMNLASQAMEGDHLLAGYPAAWDVDGFLTIECPAPGAEAGMEASDTDELAENGIAASRISVRCDASAAECAADASTSSGGDAADPQLHQSANLEVLPSPIVVTGLIHTVADGVLVLQTESGRYVTMDLPAQTPVERHTPANFDDLRTGDIVGGVVDSALGETRDVILLRVYRGARQNSVLLSRLSDDPTPQRGIEVRGIVRSTVSRADGRSIRVAYVEREGTLQMSDKIPVTIVETSSFAALRPFSVKVRALALRQANGSLLVQSIDIL